MADKKDSRTRIERKRWKVGVSQWRDWKWQMQNQVRNADDLKKLVPIGDDEERGVRLSNERFRMAITPYYASLIDFSNPMDPIRLQAIPREDEVFHCDNDLEDPLAEDVDSPVPGLTHRYPDRVLLLVTQICSMYCRHCTRRRLVGERDAHYSKSQLDLAVEYIRNHPEVRDVVVSGGDPFTLSDENIDAILGKLRAIPHVEIIRIGTRTPVVMPMRITPKLCKIIQKHHPVYVNTHFNHPNEITPEAAKACELLTNHGIPLANQSVLLRYVNDCPHVMKELVQALLKIRVRPYYIYQCDLSMGIGHFRTSVSCGINIIESLRGHTSGLAIPTFVVDAPGGGGKIPLMPNYRVSEAPGQLVLRNFEGVLARYVENPNIHSGCGNHDACTNPRYQTKEGPARMMQPKGAISIGPVPKRKKRTRQTKK